MQKTRPEARTMTTIGFIGLGSMGAPLAGRLLQENRVYGTNRTRAKASTLIRQGLIWRDTPREVAASAQVVFSMVTDDAALEAITAGPDGIQLMHKDIRLALEAGREFRVTLPAASAADRVLSQAEEKGYGHRDIAGLFQVLAAASAPGKPAVNGAGAEPRAA